MSAIARANAGETILAGENDLAKLLSDMRPVLDPVDYVFVALPAAQAGRLAGLSPLMTFREAEGVTLILPRDAAQAEGLAAVEVFKRVTLRVHSSLAAVGLTAAVSACLTEQGISANVVAAYYHDHIFVPAERSDEALAALEGLAARNR